MQTLLIIHVEDGAHIEEVLQEVTRLVGEGNTSGYHPTWDLRSGSAMQQEDADVIAAALCDGEASHYACQAVALALKKVMAHYQFDLDRFYRLCLPEQQRASYGNRRAAGETPDAASWAEHQERERA